MRRLERLCVHQNHVFAVRIGFAQDRLLPDFVVPHYEASKVGSEMGTRLSWLKVSHFSFRLRSLNLHTQLDEYSRLLLPVLIPTLGEQREIVSILDVHRPQDKPAPEEVRRAG